METNYAVDRAIIALDGTKKDVAFIFQPDIERLAKRALYVSAKRSSFPTITVAPIIDINKAIHDGSYTEAYLDFEKISNPKTSLKPKRLYLAYFWENGYCTETDGAFQRKTMDLLLEYKLRLVENPFHYFLGALTNQQEEIIRKIKKVRRVIRKDTRAMIHMPFLSEKGAGSIVCEIYYKQRDPSWDKKVLWVGEFDFPYVNANCKNIPDEISFVLLEDL